MVDTKDTTEHAIRREGQWMRVGSAVAATAVVFTAATIRHVTDTPLPPEMVSPLLLACAVTFSAGMWERAGRQARRMNAAILKSQAEMSAHLDALPGILDRLAAVEAALDKVPDYGAGVIDGVQMRQNVTTPE